MKSMRRLKHFVNSNQQTFILVSMIETAWNYFSYEWLQPQTCTYRPMSRCRTSCSRLTNHVAADKLTDQNGGKFHRCIIV